MTISYQKDMAVFLDTVAVDEAEGLLAWLIENPLTPLDFADCQHLHAANLQVLMVLKPAIAAWPKDANLRAWLESALNKY
jgi:hypothetical protein